MATVEMSVGRGRLLAALLPVTVLCPACDAPSADGRPGDALPADASAPGQAACAIDGPVTVQGTVSVVGPVQVTGTVGIQPPVQTVTADADPARHVQVSLSLGTRGEGMLVAPGPFFLTDVGAGSPLIVFESRSPDCPPRSSGSGLVIVFTAPQSAMRYLIPEGRWLCAASTDGGEVTIAGFRPY